MSSGFGSLFSNNFSLQTSCTFFPPKPARLSLSLYPLFLFLFLFPPSVFTVPSPFFPVVKVGLSHILSLMQMFLDDKSDVSAARRAQISQNSPYFDLGVGAERKERGEESV